MLDVVSPRTETIPGAGYGVEHCEQVGMNVLNIISCGSMRRGVGWLTLATYLPRCSPRGQEILL
jgi:hypothetical protein